MHTGQSTQASSWDAAVSHHREDLEDRLRNGHLRPTVQDVDVALWRASAPRWVKALDDRIVFMACLSVVVTYIALGRPFGQDAHILVVVGFFALVAGSILAFVQAGVVYDRHQFPVRGVVGAIALELDRAADAMRAAGKAGVSGADAAYDATQQLRPYLEPLLDRAYLLTDARKDAGRGGTPEAEYEAALGQRFDRAIDQLLDITAEVNAAASILFARRDDLLVSLPWQAQVEVEPQPAHRGVDESAYPDTIAGQWAAARATLAAVARG